MSRLPNKLRPLVIKKKRSKKKPPKSKMPILDTKLKLPEGEDDELAILEGEIQQLMQASHKHSVESRAEVGKRLLATKSKLKHGQWGPWLEKKSEFDESTAKRAIQLFHFRQNAPQAFAKVARLGLTKAYKLMAMPPSKRDAFLSKAHPVPSVGATKTPALMTFSQMMEVLHPPKPETKATKTNKLMRALRRQAHALERLVKDVLQAVPKLKRHTTLNAALATLLHEIEAAQEQLPKSLIGTTA